MLKITKKKEYLEITIFRLCVSLFKSHTPTKARGTEELSYIWERR